MYNNPTELPQLLAISQKKGLTISSMFIILVITQAVFLSLRKGDDTERGTLSYRLAPEVV